MFELIDFLIVRPITNILFVIYNYVGDFGLAIILFTVIVRILMWPLLKRQFEQTKLMRKIQPELAEIKKNCRGNRQLESLQMMDLYKRHNIKPFRSILTLLIQLPIFIALFTAIRVMVTPTNQDNLARRAYSFVQPLDKVQDLIKKQKPFLKSHKNGYDFHPQLLNSVNLDVRAGLKDVNEIIILLFVLGSAFAQYYTIKQQQPSKSKKRSLRQMFKEAADGKEISQSEINSVASSQMTYMMPIMMLFIMMPLPGALVFYYLLTSTISIIQQRYIFNRKTDEMDNTADKAILKELRDIKEAKIIQNKKTGTKITRISAKDTKRRKL